MHSKLGHGFAPTLFVRILPWKRISGKELDTLFQTWLFTKGRPKVSAATGVAASAARLTVKQPKSIVKMQAPRPVTLIATGCRATPGRGVNPTPVISFGAGGV